MAIELYPHNERAYQAVTKMFETSNRAAVIHPTGTGKTPIAVRVIEDYQDKKILFLTATYQILQKFAETLGSFNITSQDVPYLRGQIYSNLLSLAKDELKEQFDLIVLDEFHRCGAKEWGKGVQELLDNNENAKVLGLTATNVRFLDNERDMAYELFENNIASKMTLVEAMLEEILPVPNYVSVITSYTKDIKEIEQKIEKIKINSTKEEALKCLSKIKRKVNNMPNLDEMLAKYITKKDGKLIVFCKDIEHLEEVKKELNNLFGLVNDKLEVYEINYKHKDNLASVKEFENSKSDALKIALTIDMLNEGVHIKDLDGVIMLRRTVSPIVYLQQLGRALNVTGNVEHPLVIDVADNMRATESIFNLYAEFEKVAEAYENATLESNLSADEKNAKIKHIKNLREKFKIFDEMQETSELITKLKKFVGFGFEEYYDLLTDYYQVNGNIDVPSSYVVNGISLGRYVVKLRQARKSGNLSRKEIEMLDNYNMVWDKNEESFVIGYKYAKAYYEEQGNLLVPATYIFDSYPLGGFIRKQRANKKKGKLKPEREELLNELGMVWDVREYEFMKGYKYALEYFETHGNIDVPEGYTVDGFDLDNWLYYKRKYRTKGDLNQKEIELLDAINYDWKNTKLNWNQNFEEAKKFYEEYGHLDVDKKENHELYVWLANQRALYQKGSMNSIRKNLLDSIQMIWNLMDYKFLKGYGHAKKYFEEYGDLNVPKDYVCPDNPDFDLNCWVAEKRKHKSRMSEENIKLLDDLNMDWDPHETKWLEGYKVAKAYYEEYGNLNIPDGYVYLGYNLGNFINRNRQAYKLDKLKESRKELMDEIGMVWDVHLENWKEQLINYQKQINTEDGITKYQKEWIATTYEKLADGKLIKEQIELLYTAGLIDSETYTKYMNVGLDEDVQKL